jgi:molybdopterin/thiamine biosynthesis adenylyltransferase
MIEESMNIHEHEVQYRSAKIFDKMCNTKLFVCGAGALGSNLVDKLTRQGFKNITVIDMDRVEQKNIATQVYSLRDVGQKKVQALKSLVYQTSKNVINIIDKELTRINVDNIIKGSDIVVDTFDNWESRKIVKNACDRLKIQCVHAGMSDSGFSEIKWNEKYIIPEIEIKQNDICDYPLAANLVQTTVAILSEVIVQFISSGEKINREVTLKDLSIHKI